ncbi:dihydrofolate reductase [Cladorrhinum sp. PSN332]|nr:dihydrofolate reductase [Cladorrhinum sp. PSN332]
MPPQDLTLILAAAGTSMGIGRNGTLPWTGLKKEMAYFARVTKRLPRHPVSSVSSGPTTTTTTAKNAVIMGRKTWDSIPEKYRPLAGRLNVVISRSANGGIGNAPEVREKGDVWVSSLEKAVEFLGEKERRGEVGRVFVIGGGQVYGEAVRSGLGRRVLLTRIEGEGDKWGCDTFFEERLVEDGSGSGKGGRWVRREQEEMDEFVGEEVPRGRQEENGTGYEFEMWERVD